MQKIAIYDFCNTIVNFETADKFIFYCCDKLSIRFNSKLDNVTHRFSDIVGHFIHKSVYKKIVLKRLNGLQKEKIDILGKAFYKELILKQLNLKIIQQMEKDKNDGFVIVLCTAAYEPYLKPFVEDFGVDYCISNEFMYKDDIFVGKLLKPDCISKEKVKRIKEYFDDNNFCIEKAYGDSKSDLPLLLLAKKGFLVSKKTRKMAAKNGLDEILL